MKEKDNLLIGTASVMTFIIITQTVLLVNTMNTREQAMGGDSTFIMLIWLGMGTALMALLVAYLIRLVVVREKHKDDVTEQVKALADIYISVHRIDMGTDTYETIKSNDRIKELTKEANGQAGKALLIALDSIVRETHRDQIFEFADLATLNLRLAEVNTIEEEFAGNESWWRARFILESRYKNGKPHKVLFAVECIDAEKKKQDELRYLSETDLMTGIRNRGSGESAVRNLIAQGNRGMFCLLDADKFKSINDNYGHKTGDMVIKSIANAMKKAFREQDVIMRLGGDEFAAYAVGINGEESGRGIISRFLREIEAIDIPELKGRKVSVSVGITFFEGDTSDNFEKIYKRADRGTYGSKTVEGNAVTFM